MIDLHCHIDLFVNPRQIVSECKRRELYVLSITTTPSAWEVTSKLCEGAPRIKTALGLHPELAKDREFELPIFDRLLPKTKYVGEIGLDGSPGCLSFFDAQRRVFEHVLNSCTKAGGRIMSIHSRRASKEVLEVLSLFPYAGIPILHWFSGTVEELGNAVNQGCWFSIGPAMSKSKKGKELIHQIPKNRILLETDGPFATHNNEPLCPWDWTITVDDLCLIWKTSREVVIDQIMKNFQVLVTSELNG